MGAGCSFSRFAQGDYTAAISLAVKPELPGFLLPAPEPGTKIPVIEIDSIKAGKFLTQLLYKIMLLVRAYQE